MKQLKLDSYKIITAKYELSCVSRKDDALIQFIKQKHKKATKDNKYILALKFENKSKYDNIPDNFVYYSIVIPKGIVDNNLIENDILVKITDNSVFLSIVGIIEEFEIASSSYVDK